MSAAPSRRLPFTAAPGGIRLRVRVLPKSAPDRVLGLAEDQAGACALKLAVHAPPEDGKANEAALALLARVLGLRRRDLTLALGASDRRKLVHIAGDPARLGRQLEEQLGPWLGRG